MAKRKLEDLNLLDDFMFGKMVTYPEIGEKRTAKTMLLPFPNGSGSIMRKLIPAVCSQETAISF